MSNIDLPLQQAEVWYYNCVMVLDTTMGFADLQGLVNGVSMSGVALVRSVTPIAGGAMWDWSVTMAFSLHSFVFFVIMAFVSIGLGLLSTLPRELESTYPDIDGPTDNAVGAAH